MNKIGAFEANIESTYVGGGGHITDAWPFVKEDS